MELADLNLNKVYTYADYFRWQFVERIELIKGKIYKMSPAANFQHQLIVGRIHIELGNFLKHKQCQVLLSPFDVRFPLKSHNDEDIITVLQPDLCVVCDPQKLDKRGCLGAPDIVVEVLSPSNNKKELRYKYEVYEQSGVKEYWVVFPDAQTLLVYTLVDGNFVPSRLMVEGDIYRSTVLPDFALDLSVIFENMEA